MNKQPYTKPPLSVQKQIELLKTRGLQISDEERAARYLQNINYYRLSGYMYPFLNDKKQHIFKKGTKFDDVINLYRFDRELRLLLFASIEKIEVAIRTQIINNFSVNTNDPFWFTKTKYFTRPLEHTDFLNGITKYIGRSKDVFIKHFNNTYSNPFPPVWAIIEILSIGQLSILFNITKRSPSRKAIANYFGVRETVLASWLHALVYVRNICAHHARMWSKYLRIPVMLPKKPVKTWLSSQNISDRKIYVIFAIVAYLLDTITPTNTFRDKLKNLLVKYPIVDTSAMGFPKDWKVDPFWGCVSKVVVTNSQ